MSWMSPKLTLEQQAKCDLLEINIFLSNYPETKGRYCIGGSIYTDKRGHIRPIKIMDGHHANMFVWASSIEECFLIAADPAKYGGHWVA